ncbi:15556_t:CDS:1 [Entrophospora sp. SA101]|nr:16523_t:CDS:1 [Entrophospora sp. SA101]CAJ0749773.1 15556_t:CDS:1 [Entrophospora sp. SA101]CAJ0841402.1 18988_t:CDS:1 [Entrophospora sp. SA101]CAJ0871177.1 19861_t:CDS:1 [Entrophospora sp. SA101]CAJ0889867.1 12126_t:CDS:1 [Entrophospora sp. SA101]
MVRPRIKFGTPLFSSADYDYIMQCRDMEPRNEILKDLLKKYRTSSKRIYQIWRGEEANRVAWDQPIPQTYNHDTKCLESETRGFATDTSSANISNSATDVLHIESLSLDRDKVPLLCRTEESTLKGYNISEEPSKRTKTKRSKSVRKSNLPIITKDLIEKIDEKPAYSTDTLASFRRAVEEGKENLSNSKYKIDEL